MEWKLTSTGRLCGASYINERFSNHLLQRLAKERYLVDNKNTLKSIVEKKTVIFENYQKRVFDVTTHEVEVIPIHIEYLKANRKKGFYPNNLLLKR